MFIFWIFEFMIFYLEERAISPTPRISQAWDQFPTPYIKAFIKNVFPKSMQAF